MKTLLLAAALLASAPIGADTAVTAFTSGYKLLENLEASERVEMDALELQVRQAAREKLAKGITGYGYILGVHDTVSGVLVCIPAGVKSGQLFLVTKNYLNAHPELLHASASALVIDALKTAFPCR